MSTSPDFQDPPFDKHRFRRLLGMYVLGVAIGCVLVGLILNAKRHFRPPPPPAPAVESAPAPVEAPPATPPASPVPAGTPSKND
jgi:hypothetical protein